MSQLLESFDSNGIGLAANISQCNFTCTECNQNFKKISSLRAHCRVHIDGKPFQCALCGKCFRQNSNLKKHLNSHKVWPQGFKKSLAINGANADINYICSFCGESFLCYLKLRSHYKNHKEEKIFKCVQDDCKVTLDKIEMLLNHIKNSHSQPKYHCDKCMMIFSTLEEISEHFQPQTISCTKLKKKLDFECNYCGARFLKAGSLSHHLASTDHSFECCHCKKKFRSEITLRRHLIIHRDQKNYQCLICGALFKTKQYLHMHMLKHDERKFSCVICNSTFKRKDILIRHQKIHQTNKRIYCPFKSKGCQMEFSRSDKLNLHIKTHLNKINKSNAKLETCKSIQCASSTMEIIIVPLK